MGYLNLYCVRLNQRRVLLKMLSSPKEEEEGDEVLGTEKWPTCECR